MIYEDIHTEWFFLSPVRAKFGFRLGVGQLHIQFVQYKNHYTYGESP